MTHVMINAKRNTIEMTKAFAARACIYGTDEYRELQNARADYPSFKVVTKKSAKTGDGFKGLTYEYMENYIKEHTDESRKSVLIHFYTLCGKDEEGNTSVAITEYASYGEIKKWFLKAFPEIANSKTNQRNRINEILENVVA